MLAMEANDNAGYLTLSGVWTSIATVRRLDKLAPTGATNKKAPLE
ncbi:hypothetical protein [Pseudomonas sp. S2_C03]